MKETNLKKAATLTVSVAGLAVGVGLVANQPAVHADTTQPATTNESTDNQNAVTSAQNKVTAAQSAVTAASAAVTSAEAANSAAQAKVTATKSAADKAAQTSATAQVSFLKSGDQGQATNTPSEMDRMFSHTAAVKLDGYDSLNVTIHSNTMSHMISNFQLVNEKLGFTKINEDAAKDAADWRVILMMNLPKQAEENYLLGMTINTGMPVMNEEAYLKVIYPQSILDALKATQLYGQAVLDADATSKALKQAQTNLTAAEKTLSEAKGALKAAEALAPQTSSASATPTPVTQTSSASAAPTPVTQTSNKDSNDVAFSKGVANQAQSKVALASTTSTKLTTPVFTVNDGQKVVSPKTNTLPQTGNEKSGLALLGLALMSMLVMPIKKLAKNY